MASQENDPRPAFYERVCEGYQAIDDFRMKLLGLLPVATGTGVFLLLNGKAELIGSGNTDVKKALAAIGIFGFIFTLGLFTYELFGIKKCHYLIVAGKRLEAGLGIQGQFSTRPAEMAGFVAEPFASSVIYPACLAAWLFLALVFSNGKLAALMAGVVFFAGCAATMVGIGKMKRNEEDESWVLDRLTVQGSVQVNALRKKRRFKQLNRAIQRLDKRDLVTCDKDNENSKILKLSASGKLFYVGKAE
jgi:hypothetical protein